MRSLPIAAVLAAAGLASLHAWVAQAPQTTFRAGTDLVQVDVSVLDNERRPVRGLTAADFTLLEDGKPRPVVAFTAVDLPERFAPASAPWTHEIESDVATNAIPEEGRLVVILMDRSIPQGFATLNAQQIARTAVSELGFGDYAAVVYTGGGAPQGFTNDRQKLYSAITGDYPAAELSADANAVWSGLVSGLENQRAAEGTAIGALEFSTDCMCGACVLEAVTRIADAVRDVGRRRKSLLFIGRDLQIETVDPICVDPVRKARNVMFQSLDLASMTVHSLDPSGLETLAPMASVRAGRYGGRANLVSQGNIAVLPDRTGGRTVKNTNNPSSRVPEIFAESDSYYLLGFRPQVADGQRHDISVKVNRSGLNVRTRREYIATPTAVEASAAQSPTSAPAMASIAGLLPERRGVSLSAQATSHPAPKTRESVLAVAIHVEHDASATAPRTLAPAPEQVDVVTGVFTMSGRAVGTLRQTLMVMPQIGTGGAVSYDVLQRLPARPGRYELRIGLTNQTRRQAGSVYTFVDIPDYPAASFVMGDIGIFAPQGMPAMKENLADILPVPPTARREFGRGEPATAFMRFYQGFGAPPVSVFLKAQILDERNRKRFGQDGSIPSSTFSNGSTADYIVDLPLPELERGEYLLTVEAKAGSRTSRRDVIFSVR